MLELIDTLSLPFLAVCLVIYTTVMGWLIFRRDKLPSRLEKPVIANRPRQVRRR